MALEFSKLVVDGDTFEVADKKARQRLDTADQTITALEERIEQLIGGIYPVGSIYMSVNDVNPSTIFGGTWEKIKDTFLLASGDTYSNGSTGGEATHVLTTAELPKHTHSIPQLSGTTNETGEHKHAIWSSNAAMVPSGSTYGINASNNMNSWSGSNGKHSHTVTTNASTTGENGSGTAHNNLPPYLVVNVWKRTA